MDEKQKDDACLTSVETLLQVRTRRSQEKPELKAVWVVVRQDAAVSSCQESILVLTRLTLDATTCRILLYARIVRKSRILPRHLLELQPTRSKVESCAEAHL